MKSDLRRIIRCAVCGRVVSEDLSGAGALVCCNQPMELVVTNIDESATAEKHLPVITETASGYLVKVGNIPHPMTIEHCLLWIELAVDGKAYRTYLNPGRSTDSSPQAEFSVPKGKQLTARTYCNIHGLWQVG